MRIRWIESANETVRLDEQLDTSGLDEICQIYKGKALYGQVYIFFSMLWDSLLQSKCICRGPSM